MHRSTLNLYQFQVKYQRGPGRDIVHLGGAVTPLGGNDDLPFIAFVHGREGDLPAHYEVAHYEECGRDSPSVVSKTVPSINRPV